MLIDAGATGVLLGHSERRALFGETDEALARKLAAALAHGLEPVLCIGESEAERDGGATEARLGTQLDGGLAGLGASQVLQVTIAYEPVWAIGTGRSATPEIAQETHAFIRGALSARYGEECAAAVRILYGGSVKPDNAAALLAQPDVDGALVGGASLDPRRLRGDRPRGARGLMAAPVALVVLDGFGCAPEGPGNAVRLARTPVFDALWERWPHTTLTAAGPRGGPARRADGQLRGRPPQHRRRARGRAGSRARRAMPWQTARWPRTRPCRPPSRRPDPAGASCTSPGSSPTVACTRMSITCARSWRARSRPAFRAWRCTRSRTGATSRRTRRPACSAVSNGSGQAPVRSSRP